MKTYNLQLTQDQNDRPFFITLHGYDYMKHIPEMVRWSSRSYGPIPNKQWNNPRWNIEGRTGARGFRFKYERDATWFLLKWS